MSFVEREFERFVGLVYEAPFDAKLWPQTLETLGRAFDGLGAVFIRLPGVSPALGDYSPAALAEAGKAYRRHWSREDFIARRALESRLHGVFSDCELSTPQERRESAYFQEFRRLYGIGDVINYFDCGESGTFTALSLKLPIGRPGLDDDERKMFDRFAAHAGRALRMAARVEAAPAPRSLLEDALDVLAAPVAIVGADGRVVFANRAFAALGGRGLEILDRRLVAEAPAQQGALDRLIGQALAPALAGGGALALHSAGGRPLIVQIAPLPPRDRLVAAPALRGRRLALALVTDPDHRGGAGAAALVAAGLTPAEAKAAERIGAGLSPAQTAAELGNSEATVRTLLKRVYEKLGIARQSQLARLASQLSVFPPDLDVRRRAGWRGGSGKFLGDETTAENL